jgi:hypothetical protein
MEGEKRSATGVGSGLPRAPAQRVQVQEGRRSSKSNGKRPQVDVHGSYRAEEDELRGMGLGMAVQQPGLNGHDHMTGGMGFGDQFWSGSFPNPTPGSDRKSPGLISRSKADSRLGTDTITHVAQHVTLWIPLQHKQWSLADGRIRYRPIRFCHLIPNAKGPGRIPSRRFFLQYRSITPDWRSKYERENGQGQDSESELVQASRDHSYRSGYVLSHIW